MTEPIKLGIGLPAYRGIIASSQAKMWAQIGAYLVQSVNDIQIHGFADLDMNGIDNARNTLVAVMRHQCDWLLMVDSDTWAMAGGDLIRMIVDASKAPDVAIVGAPVVTRGIANPVNVYRYEAIEQEDGFRRVKASPIPRGEIPTDRMIEVDAIGGAIMAINLHLTEGIEFRFTERQEGGRTIRSSEDHEFCRQVRERKLRILADGRIKTVHENKPGYLVYDPSPQLRLDVTP